MLNYTFIPSEGNHSTGLNRYERHSTGWCLCTTFDQHLQSTRASKEKRLTVSCSNRKMREGIIIYSHCYLLINRQRTCISSWRQSNRVNTEILVPVDYILPHTKSCLRVFHFRYASLSGSSKYRVETVAATSARLLRLTASHPLGQFLMWRMGI